MPRLLKYCAALSGGLGLLAGLAFTGPAPEAEPDLVTQVAQIVAEAARVEWHEGGTLLPAETTVDRAEWHDHLLHIDLTIAPSAGRWHVGLKQMEEISEALAEPFMADANFRGTVIRVRGGLDEPYGTLEDFVPFNAPIPPPMEVAPDALSEPPPEPDQPAEAGERGPVAQAARQPTGALSGVVIFAAAGHGWTANTSAGGTWFLQRPVLWTMNEDYGNLEQLNYFVHYAFNAGATVVPFRPVGYQDVQVVVDNDDGGPVTFSGDWVDAIAPSRYYERGFAFGAPYKQVLASETETATARYTPTSFATGFYPVYCFVGAADTDIDRTVQTYRIKHSAGITEVTVDHRRVANGWVWLGDYYCGGPTGESYVEITNQSPVAGIVIADAIRWGNGLGDIVRPGPNTVSGFGRDEECQRYWAQSELGNNAVGFSAAAIWDSSSSDQNDNISTAGRWARAMNLTAVNNERWRRVYLEFHSNAATGSARGTLALVTDTGATTNQVPYATILGDEVEADMVIAAADFEHPWALRSNPLTGSYGAISTNANGNEFDATILEVAFHDNQQDAELMRDPRVRAALARASVHGLIKFLRTLPGSQVPLAFPPDTPRNVRVVDAGGGSVTLSWTAPLSDAARGDPATGYVVYESSNGYGFNVAATLGNVLTTTLSGLALGETRYYRIAATNAGGESMPSEVIAVRRPPLGRADVLIVNGFDRQRRQQNPTENVGGVIERAIWRRTNSFDYVVQHAEALAAAGAGFASCANEAIIDGQIALGDYAMVVWILGEESSQDRTFDNTEQALVTNYLNAGGNLFLSGAEIAWDLDQLNNGRAFYENVLGANYVADDANTFSAIGAAGSIFADVPLFNFDVAAGAPYLVDFPDVIAPQPGGQVAITYNPSGIGTAAVTFDTGVYRVVNLGFPFETITSATRRNQIMQRAVDYLGGIQTPIPFDSDDDGDVDLADYQAFRDCLLGPEVDYASGAECLIHDGDADLDVDLADYAGFQTAFDQV